MKRLFFRRKLFLLGFAICSLTTPIFAAPSLAELVIAETARINEAKKQSFYKAAAEGDNVQILALLNQGFDINSLSMYPNGEFQGGSIIMVGIWQGPALAVAAGNGQLKTVELLLSRGANINAQDENGANALLYAARYGHLQTVKVLLKHQAEVNPKDDSAQKPLIEATRYGHFEVVHLLLQNGADVNTTDFLGSTSLILAIARKNIRITNLLLKYKADVNIKDHSMNTAIIAAVKSKSAPELIAKLIKKGSDVNTYNNYGHTALQNIAPKTQLETVRLLKAAGARLYGWTKLMYAVNEKDLPKVKLLLKRGAEINEKAAYGHSALTMAVGNPEMLKFLLANGADVNIKDNYGQTTLMSALASGEIESARILLEQGCDPNSQTVFRDSALMAAVQYPEVIRLLIEKGADVHYVNRDGKTVLDVAVAGGRGECVEILEKAGAKRGTATQNS